MEYPHFSIYSNKEDLIEHFTLSEKDRDMLPQWGENRNMLGFAVLLKSFMFLGYPPQSKDEIPVQVVSLIAQQLNIDLVEFNRYIWKKRLWFSHIDFIRSLTGYRPFKEDDYNQVSVWLVNKGCNYPSRQKMCFAAIKRFREIHLELPTEKEFRRLVNSAWRQFFDASCQKISNRLSSDTVKRMELCLNTNPQEIGSYEWIKSRPGKFGMKSIRREVKRRLFIDGFGINAETHFKDVPAELLKLMRDRSSPEGAYQIKRHRPKIRYALLASLIYHRRMEVTDNIVKIFLHLIRRIEKKADQSLVNELVKDIEKIYGKRLILYKIAKAAVRDPGGSVQNVLFPEIGKDTFHKVIEEYEGQELGYEKTRVKEKKKKYKCFYRQMMKPVMGTLIFRSNNPMNQPLLDGIALVQKYLDKKNVYYPGTEDIPEELLTGDWQETAIELDQGIPRVVKHYFELCVLQKLEKAIKCKKIWVEHAYKYRDPDKDLPQDWQKNRLNYYNKHSIPKQPKDFIEPIREELTEVMMKTNDFFSRKRDVYIYYPGEGENGFFRIPKIIKRPERPILQEIKRKVVQRWGIQELVDVLLEADRHVNFTRFFYSTAQRHVLKNHEIRERLLISLLGRGTGLGLKRIHAATKPSFSYDDLLYFNKRFVHIDSLREAIASLFDRINEVRNPEIWKVTTACTSDAKYLSAWEQNLSTEWNPHYKKHGIMSYWHADKNSAGIYSQLRGTSEVSAMIAGLILHNTMMNIESNYVDTLGQSEMAFAFCRFLSVELMPWLKRMKYERLHLPDKGLKDSLPYLSGVLDRPIRWNQVYACYDDMVRHVVAAKEKTGPIDSILRRFNRNNPGNPTYKGFVEIGKALKTIHDCKFLTDKSYRIQIHDGRNVIESWNSVTDFIGYGGKTEISTNDPEIQEITVLCLHLLQNALVLVNTVMLEKVLYDDGYIDRMKEEDLNAMTPLFTSNINPYGDIRLDINKPSIFEVTQ